MVRFYFTTILLALVLYVIVTYVMCVVAANLNVIKSVSPTLILDIWRFGVRGTLIYTFIIMNYFIVYFLTYINQKKQLLILLAVVVARSLQNVP